MEKVSDFLRETLISALARSESLRNAQIDPKAIQDYIDQVKSIIQEIKAP